MLSVSETYTTKSVIADHIWKEKGDLYFAFWTKLLYLTKGFNRKYENSKNLSYAVLWESKTHGRQVRGYNPENLRNPSMIFHNVIWSTKQNIKKKKLYFREVQGEQN